MAQTPRGTVRRQGKESWEVRVPYRDPMTGRTVRRSFTVKGTKREAEQRRAQLVADSLAGRNADSRDLLSVFVRQWETSIAPTVRENTLRSYREKLKVAVDEIGGLRLSEISAPVLSSMYGKLLAAGYSPRTVSHVHRVLSRMFRDAVRWGLLQVPPTQNVDPPRVPVSEVQTWNTAEMVRFLDQTRGSRLWPLWWVLALTGMRRGEALGLRWSDVDLEAGQVRVVRSWTRAEGGRPEYGNTKTGRGRTVALDTATVDVLRRLRKSTIEERLASGIPFGDDEPVFARPDGSAMLPDSVSQAFRRAVCRVEGIRPIRLHDLRHAHATIALAAGVPAKVVSERLGHSRVAVTLDTYSHVIPGMQEDAAERIFRALSV